MCIGWTNVIFIAMSGEQLVVEWTDLVLEISDKVNWSCDKETQVVKKLGKD